MRMIKGTLPAAVDGQAKIRKQAVTVDGVTVSRITFAAGALWSRDLAGRAGTPTCRLPHVALVLSGALGVRMDDGVEEVFRANDVMLLPPGHDAWTVGDEPCVFVDFSQGYDRYGQPAGGERLG